MICEVPRIVIAGTSSGVGKTTVTLALITALIKSGLKVQPFKVGPDYIDTGYHNLAASRMSRNLDGYLMDQDKMTEIFARSAADADIAVIEGVMGLFDGDGKSRSSTAAVAKILRTPVVLVIDARGMGRSAAAVAHGFSRFDPGVDLAGVILNNIGSDRHSELLDEALTSANVKVLGRLKRDEGFVVKERHLGLVPAGEEEGRGNLMTKLCAIGGTALDLAAIEATAKAANPITWESSLFGLDRKNKAMIGVARDKAFNFYYQDNLELIESYGAELDFFSPLEDCGLPDGIDGLYLGGGFPEVFADPLSANAPMKTAIKDAVSKGMPVYGECGGLVYLAEELTDFNGKSWEMCGSIKAKASMNKNLQALGYRRATAVSDNLITVGGKPIVGHEFRYSSLSEIDKKEKRAYRIGSSRNISFDGFSDNNLLASYIHLHFASDPVWAENLVEKCHAYGKGAR